MQSRVVFSWIAKVAKMSAAAKYFRCQSGDIVFVGGGGYKKWVRRQEPIRKNRIFEYINNFGAYES